MTYGLETRGYTEGYTNDAEALTRSDQDGQNWT